MNDKTYNGWKNRETWNVALYIQNDYQLYQIAKDSSNYSDFLFKSHRVRGTMTPDGVLWQSAKISWTEINEMLRELRS
jgi:hypothetical protein